MPTTAELIIPGSRSVVGFWLLAIALGSGLVLLFNLLTTVSGEEALIRTLGISFFALLLSLPSLLLLFALIPWALGSPSLFARRLQLVVAQSVSAGVTFGLAHWLIQDHQLAAVLPQITGAYLAVGLAAAYWRYAAWLARPA